MRIHFISPAFVLVIALIGGFLLPSQCSAQESAEADAPEPKTDIEGCADLMDLPKLPTSITVSCDKGASMEVTMPLKPDARGTSREKNVRGAYEFREYQILQGDQQEQAFDNLMQLLPISGFNIKFSSSPSTITGCKDGAWVIVNVSGDFYNVKVVHVNEDPWNPIVDAPGILREMEARHRAAIYGITFTPDSQAIVEQRSPILAEVLKFLQANPGLTFRVESHKMSNDGTSENDQEITRKRASAVATWLEAHGIARGHLQSLALGRSKPLTDNDTPSEIRRNERIVLAILQ